MRKVVGFYAHFHLIRIFKYVCVRVIFFLFLQIIHSFTKSYNVRSFHRYKLKRSYKNICKRLVVDALLSKFAVFTSFV
jgi:hypothetical protein